MSSPAVRSKKTKEASSQRLGNFIITFGLFLAFCGLLIIILTFYPVITAELRYAFFPPNKLARVSLPGQKSTVPTIYPVDTDFGIVIPKIGANARIIANIDPENERQYQIALTYGIAHAKGTVFPGQIGNIFLFAHSAGNFYEANQFNAVFYLLDKLEKDDRVVLFYKNEKFVYKVTAKKIVPANSVQFLSPNSVGKTMTLMTCWPAGTTLKRLIVEAVLN